MAHNALGDKTNVSVLVNIGRMFYIMDPTTHMYEFPHQVPDYFAEILPFFFAAIVLEFVLGVVTGAFEHRMFYVYNNVAGGIMQTLFHKFVFTPFSYYLFCYIYEHYRIVTLPWDSVWTWYLSFLGVDFAYYWFHRLSHEVNFLWASHQMHHNSEDFNLTTGMRQSLFQKYFKGFPFLPMAIIIPPSIHLIHQQFNLMFQLWIHTEVVGKLGPLEYILNTASHHRVHHGRNPYCIDKNYGGTLIIWDRLFNTFAEEDEKVAYGLVSMEESVNPMALQTGHYIDIAKRFMRLEKWSDKISCLVRGPGWMAECEKEGIPPEQLVLSEVEQPIRKRDMEHFKMYDRLETYYVSLHLLITTIVFQEFLARRMASLSVAAVYACLTYIFWTLTSCGFVLENRWFWCHIEAFRCFAMIVADIYLTLNSIKNPLISTYIVYAVRAVNVLSLLVTCFHILAPRDNPTTKADEKKRKKVQ